MKVKVKNLGVLTQAEFELGELTIICGENNTGKTYATYALYGFLKFWKNSFAIPIKSESIEQLLNDGTVRFDITDFINDSPSIVRRACKHYSSILPKVFASSEKYFEKSSFEIVFDKDEITPLASYALTLSSAKQGLIKIHKEDESSDVTVSLLIDKGKTEIPPLPILKEAIGAELKKVVFEDFVRNPFIASAERTGAAIFREELNFPRNRLLKGINKTSEKLDILTLIGDVFDSPYALPVQDNVDFTRQLESLNKKVSFIAKEHSSILSDFSDIIGGEYRVVRSALYYVPNHDKKLRLTMDESSSAVRSMLDIGFYLRHLVQPGDMLIVDEPELNLHPENQRRVARLFARLINIGIHVFVTTHSDYFVKELNTLIMLNGDAPHLKEICKKEGYKKDELLNHEKVRVYVAEKKKIKLEETGKNRTCSTLVPADIDPIVGIEVTTFDTTIDNMNSIQENILLGYEED